MVQKWIQVMMLEVEQIPSDTTTQFELYVITSGAVWIHWKCNVESESSHDLLCGRDASIILLSTRYVFSILSMRNQCRCVVLRLESRHSFQN